MEQNDQDIIYAIRPLGERVASLETSYNVMEEKLDQIGNKLDDLLTLKHKGMGAIKLVSIIAIGASGLVGFIAMLLSIFGGKH